MTDLTPEHRADLVESAIHFQKCAADAHRETLPRQFFDQFRAPRNGAYYQNCEAAYARHARECLFELLGVEPE